MKILEYFKKLFRSKKSCGRCNHFESLDDHTGTMSYGFCKTYQIAVFEESTEECFRAKNTIKVTQDPYAPRWKNTPYPLDVFAESHIRQWLDDVYWKHHG